jgi:hypothetical protein
MTKIAIRVEADHLDELVRPSRSLTGVIELIWNGLDAEASEVAIRVLGNNLEGVDEVVVTLDDCPGWARRPPANADHRHAQHPDGVRDR